MIYLTGCAKKSAKNVFKGSFCFSFSCYNYCDKGFP